MARKTKEHRLLSSFLKRNEDINMKNLKVAVDKEYLKWAKKHERLEVIRDYIDKVAYNYYKKNGERISRDRVLWYLENFKGVDLSDVKLRNYYIGFVTKTISSTMRRIYLEKKREKEKKQEFMSLILEMQNQGFISERAVNFLLSYFFGIEIEKFKNSDYGESLAGAVFDILSRASFLYPEKKVELNALVSFLSSDKISDEELEFALDSVKNWKLINVSWF